MKYNVGDVLLNSGSRGYQLRIDTKSIRYYEVTYLWDNSHGYWDIKELDNNAHYSIDREWLFNKELEKTLCGNN